jgi:hypothetical protein
MPTQTACIQVNRESMPGYATSGFEPYYSEIRDPPESDGASANTPLGKLYDYMFSSMFCLTLHEVERNKRNSHAGLYPFLTRQRHKRFTLLRVAAV